MAKEATFGLDENVAGALAYVLIFISGIVFFLFEEENEFVRFHALQSVITFLGLWIASMLVSFLAVASPVSVFMLGNLIRIAGILLWIVLMIKAYKGEKYELPVIGDIVKKHI